MSSESKVTEHFATYTFHVLFRKGIDPVVGVVLNAVEVLNKRVNFAAYQEDHTFGSRSLLERRVCIT